MISVLKIVAYGRMEETAGNEEYLLIPRKEMACAATPTLLIWESFIH